MDFSAFAWRDVIMLVVVCAAVYLLVALLRLRAVKSAKPTSLWRKPLPPQDQAHAEPSGDTVPMWQATRPLTDAPSESLPQAQAEFGEHLYRSAMEAQLSQLRAEVAAVRRELTQLKAARRVSPQYAEAMLLAQRGMDVQVIADQCGISLGEAELVLALSRDKQEYEGNGENNGPRSPAG